MYLVRALDEDVVYPYETLEKIYSTCEGWDVHEGNYEFRDDLGNEYEVEWIEPATSKKILFGLMTSITNGHYRLVKKSQTRAG